MSISYLSIFCQYDRYDWPISFMAVAQCFLFIVPFRNFDTPVKGCNILSREGSLSCETCYDTMPRFFCLFRRINPIQSPFTTNKEYRGSILVLIRYPTGLSYNHLFFYDLNSNVLRKKDHSDRDDKTIYHLN